MASLVRDIISEAIAHKVNDPRISPLASVTRVEISGDLQLAKVYVSVFGSESENRKTMAGLENATGHIQRFLSKRLHTRHCPELHFIADKSIKCSLETVQIIEESVREDIRHHGSGDSDAETTASPKTDSDGAGP
ncbi:MAG: 30S ribosome-binding factor RbfA [Phycisphaerae bacterium]|nr:30S ribosome-binding factor RbfA [Phycisphaerae bacterium]